MTMIEKIGREIAASFGSKAFLDYDNCKKFYDNVAKTALEALKEPTPEMMAFYCCESCNPSFEQNYKTAIEAALDGK